LSAEGFRHAAPLHARAALSWRFKADALWVGTSIDGVDGRAGTCGRPRRL